MVYISCIIRATILRCDYPVLYVPRFFVVSTTILASILRCDLTFAKMSTLAFADGHKHDVISCLLVNIATNWTVLHSHPFKMSIRCDNMIIKLQDFMFSSFKISLRCSKYYHTATPVMSHDSYTKWLAALRIKLPCSYQILRPQIPKISLCHHRHNKSDHTKSHDQYI